MPAHKMERSNQDPLPPQLLEALGAQAALPSLTRIVESIGCIAADPPEGAVISCPVISTCTELPRSRIMPVLRGLEATGLATQYKPDPSERPAGGRWIVAKTLCFTLTDLGKELLPIKVQENCKLRNPFIRPTARQKSFIDCARCQMSKPDKTGVVPPGSFTVKRVAECQNQPVKTTHSIADEFHDQGLLRRTLCSRKAWGRGSLPTAYTPTNKGEPWLTPLAAPNCRFKEAPAKMFNVSQQAVVDSIAEIFLTVRTGETEEVIRQPLIMRRTGLPKGTVNGVFQKLIREGYLVKRSTPNGNKTDGYELTAKGGHVLATQSNLGQALIDADVIVHPDQVLVIFEQYRTVLLGVARRTLGGMSDLWVEDVISEAALHAHRRYVLDGVPPLGGQESLKANLNKIVRSRAIDLLRQEMRLERKEEKFVAQRHEPAAPDVVDTATRNAYSDQLLTVLARLFLVMNKDQRDVVLNLYKKETGADMLSSSTPPATLKTRLHYARKEAARELLSTFLPNQASAGSDSDMGSVAKAVAHQILLGELDGMKSSTLFDDARPDLIEMKALIRSVLYPDGETEAD